MGTYRQNRILKVHIISIKKRKLCKELNAYKKNRLLHDNLLRAKKE